MLFNVPYFLNFVRIKLYIHRCLLGHTSNHGFSEVLTGTYFRSWIFRDAYLDILQIMDFQRCLLEHTSDHGFSEMLTGTYFKSWIFRGAYLDILQIMDFLNFVRKSYIFSQAYQEPEKFLLAIGIFIVVALLFVVFGL